MRDARFALWLAAALAAVGCAPSGGSSGGGADGGRADGGPPPCDTARDRDGDGIPNGVEGCRAGVDTDRDGTPDWRDTDSDGDGIPDSIERGPRDSRGGCAGAPAGRNGWPCDSDGDGTPDYRDVDADNDGLLDRDEDRNGDGRIGCCLAACGKPTAAQARECRLAPLGSGGKPTATSCGRGQTCKAGRCTPAVGLACSGGETDPRKADTFGDGKRDGTRVIDACRDATATRARGRRRLKLATSPAAEGDWQVAYPWDATYKAVTIAGRGAKMAVAVIDQTATGHAVAGLVASRRIGTANLTQEVQAILTDLRSELRDASLAVTNPGIAGRAHDGYPAVFGVTIDATLFRPTRPSDLRDRVLARLIGRPARDLSGLPAPFGPAEYRFVIRFSVVRRHGFKTSGGKVVKDARGNPVDSGDTTRWRLLVTGGVAPRSAYVSPTGRARAVLDALADATGLARRDDRLARGCDVATFKAAPLADVIWVVDESGSMVAKRQQIARAAGVFVSAALESGLDLRVCVTGVVDPKGSFAAAVGSCCGARPLDARDVPTDAFLSGMDARTIAACIENPPGYEAALEHGLINARAAVTRHLPRGVGKDKIRPGARVVVIIASDEVPASLGTTYSTDWRKCTLRPDARKHANDTIAPYIRFFRGSPDPATAAVVHSITGTCTGSTAPTCTSQVGHGYIDLARALGGLTMGLCDADIDGVARSIVAHTAAATLPRILVRVPVSASLAVNVDGKDLLRGRTPGFHYRPAARRLGVAGLKLAKGSRVGAGYWRWLAQDRL